jgi:hypothetical protein
MADINWLYSSLSQSTAAIVAIIGGFLTTKVVSIDIEKRSHLARIQDISEETEQKKSELEEFEVEYNELKNKIIEQSILDLIRKEDKLPDTEQLIDSLRDSMNMEFDESLISFIFSKYADLSQEYLNASIVIEDIFDSEIDVPEDFKDFKLKFKDKIHGLNQGALELSFDKQFEGDSRSLFSHLYTYHRNDYLEEILSKIEKTKAAINSLDTRRKSLEESVKYLIGGNILKYGFYSIVVFTILGLMVPLFWMPIDSNHFTCVDKYVPLSLFIIGITLVFAFIFFQIRSLIKS